MTREMDQTAKYIALAILKEGGVLEMRRQHEERTGNNLPNLMAEVLPRCAQMIEEYAKQK